MPRILIVDDDPVSLHFLAAAVSGFDCHVVTATNAAEALTAAQGTPFDALLIDRRLPDASGAQLLAQLRQRDVGAPALATSAELDPRIEADLKTAGFDAAIAKPLTVEQLYAFLAPYLSGSPAPTGGSLLDDDSARRATGSDAATLRALRRLFLDELAQVEIEWRGAGNVTETERLHRLRASCGFCGATALAAAALRLETAVRAQAASVPRLLADFLELCRRTREQLLSLGVGAS